jgi:hypothetical protein
MSTFPFITCWDLKWDWFYSYYILQFIASLILLPKTILYYKIIIFNNNNLFRMKQVQKSLIHKNLVYHSVWFFPNLMVNCFFVNSETINDYFLINFVSLSFIFLIFTIHQFLNLLNSLGRFSPRIALSFIPRVLIFNLFLNLYSKNYYQIHLLILRLLIFVFL